jgi:NAD-dependent deacetylase
VSAGEGQAPDGDQAVDHARRLIGAASRVAVLTGAGISTASGIPDYRGPSGVWTRDPAAERTATLSHYLGDPEVRRRSWRNRLHSPMWAARPNAGHQALVTLGRRGVLTGLVTQNVDGLHQRAGSDPLLVIELHGNAHRTRCWTCGDERPMGEAVERVRAGEDDPACLLCGGILKSTTISFGESLDRAVLLRAGAVAEDAEVLLVAGSSLTVHPAAGLVPMAAGAGARIVIANQEATPYDGIADAVLRGDLSTVLPAVVGGL